MLLKCTFLYFQRVTSCELVNSRTAQLRRRDSSLRYTAPASQEGEAGQRRRVSKGDPDRGERGRDTVGEGVKHDAHVNCGSECRRCRDADIMTRLAEVLQWCTLVCMNTDSLFEPDWACDLRAAWCSVLLQCRRHALRVIGSRCLRGPKLRL